MWILLLIIAIVLLAPGLLVGSLKALLWLALFFFLLSALAGYSTRRGP